MQGIRVEQQFSRRQVLGLLATAGGALLIAACGGSATAIPATATPAASAISSTAPSVAASSAPSAPPSATASATPAASGSASPIASTAASPTIRPASPVAASPVAATPRASASPIVAPGGPFLSAGTDLGRMLATVPRDADILRSQWGFIYSNLGQQLQNYNLGGTKSIGDLDTQESFNRFSKAIAPLALPMEVGPDGLSIGEEEWRAVVGYDFWQVDRTFGEENPDAPWVRLEGRFDRDTIAKALVNSKRTTSQYREGTIYSYGLDGGINPQDPVTDRLGLIGSFSRTVIEEAALASVKTTQLAEMAIDVRAGRVPSLLANPDYDALAFALDPLAGGALLPPEQIYGRVNQNGTPVPPGTPPASAERLPLYRRVGIGLQDDGTKRTMLIALAYEKAEDARAAAPLIRRRVENYKLMNGARLRDLAVMGEPRVVAAGSRTVTVLPFAIGDDKYLAVWKYLFNNRDLGFLKEY